MLRKSLLFIPVLFIMIMVSCRPARIPVSSGSTAERTISYVNAYKDLAISEMRRTGVPASITLAQGMIESDYGRSTLATKANNHFGIKCHTDWKGVKYFMNDDRKNECFRQYRTAEESFRDHSDFLVSGSRYDFLFTLKPDDYQAWARGLKKAGYATNPDYAELLIRKIEEYDLHQYDTSKGVKDNGKVITDTRQQSEVQPVVVNNVPVMGDNIVNAVGYSRILSRNRVNYIIVKESDTFESLLDEFQLLRFELQKYNELTGDFKIQPGQILYIQPKRSRADIGYEYHTVEKGETIYDISQLYGIKLKSLIEMNRLAEGQEPVEGDKIWLRSIKPLL